MEDYVSRVEAMALQLTSQQFGRYRLIRCIATGGFAEVWRAKTLGAAGFERLVAVKRILPRMSQSRDFVERLTREATFAAQLSHANIVQVFDFNQVDGSYYLAMELVEGKDLRQVLRRGKSEGKPLQVAQAVYIGCEVLKALSYAHERQFGKKVGVFHRDLTPHNILLSFQGEVKLAAFGTGDATLLGMDAASLKQKLSYFSPEQLSGEAGDGRSDLFMFGTVLYEMLTGERCFSGKDEAEVIEEVKSKDPVPPSSRAQGAPKELDAFVLSLLSKDPAGRPKSAREAYRVLSDFLHAYVKEYSAIDLSAYVSELFSEESGALELNTPGTERMPGRARAAQPEFKTAEPGEVTGPLPRMASLEGGKKRRGLWVGVALATAAALSAAAGYFLFFGG